MAVGRLTMQTMSDNILINTQRNLQDVARYQEQLSSGKRIKKMSDDPIAARRALISRIELSQNEKYVDNIDKSLAFMSATDSTMSEMISVFDTAKSIAVQGASATQDAASRESLAESVEAQLDRLIDLTNGVHDGRFIFSGTASLTKPFELNADRDDVTYAGDLDNFEVSISFSSRSIVNQNGYELWKSEVDVFGVLVDLRQALRDNDAARADELIEAVDLASNHINRLQGELGGRMERMELTRSQHETSQIQLGELISEQEDVDIAETIMRMQNAQVALEAALQAGARAIQPSLLDFI